MEITKEQMKKTMTKLLESVEKSTHWAIDNDVAQKLGMGPFELIGLILMLMEQFMKDDGVSKDVTDTELKRIIKEAVKERGADA